MARYPQPSTDAPDLGVLYPRALTNPGQAHDPKVTIYGERIPPVHRPHKRKGCQWIHGSGWVWNPTRKWIDA